MGSNIGTTLTAWILSLAGINSSSVLLSMLKPENFSPVIALIGVIMIMVCKTQKRRDMGGVMVGFAILMFGMTMMGDAVAPLKDIPEFASILTSFNNPVLGVHDIHRHNPEQRRQHGHIAGAVPYGHDNIRHGYTGCNGP